MTTEKNKPEYAPLYSTNEKIQKVFNTFIWIIPCLLLFKYWVLPWFNHYMKRAACIDYGFITGLEWGFYLSLNLPILIIFLYLVLFQSKHFYHIIKQGQCPLPYQKVFHPTRYTYGKKAKIKGYLFFLYLGLLFCFWLYSFKIVQDITNTTRTKDKSKLHCAQVEMVTIPQKNTN